MRDLGILAGLVAWLVYTRVYWGLHAAHFVLPPCPFYYLTGHPCPFCGGTRSFAYMWQGNLSHAAGLYPLGPLMFVGTLAAVPVLLAAVVTDRALDWRLATSVRRGLLVAGCLALAVSWSLKLTVLPN